MFIMPSLKKSLIVEQFQGNYLKLIRIAKQWWSSRSRNVRQTIVNILSDLSFIYKVFYLFQFTENKSMFGEP